MNVETLSCMDLVGGKPLMERRRNSVREDHATANQTIIQKVVLVFFLFLQMFSILDEWREDRVTIDDKSLLPVRSVHFGDTGTPFDDKEGRFNVGPLICHQTVGDSTLLTHPVLLYPPAITPSSHNNLPASITFSFK